jgi:hypothetical protein
MRSVARDEVPIKLLAAGRAVFCFLIDDSLAPSPQVARFSISNISFLSTPPGFLFFLLVCLGQVFYSSSNLPSKKNRQRWVS